MVYKKKCKHLTGENDHSEQELGTGIKQSDMHDIFRNIKRENEKNSKKKERDR